MAKRSGRFQYAALPYRVSDGSLQVMLITSRDTGRWVIPKGWPEKYLLAHQVAEREAYEEAGFEGSVRQVPLACFDYPKYFNETHFRLCTVVVFPMFVSNELMDWPERAERERCWMNAEEAAEKVCEEGLKTILRRASAERRWLREGGLMPVPEECVLGAGTD